MLFIWWEFYNATSLPNIKTFTYSTLVGWSSCGTFSGGWQWWCGESFYSQTNTKVKQKRTNFKDKNHEDLKHGGDGVVDLYYWKWLVEGEVNSIYWNRLLETGFNPFSCVASPVSQWSDLRSGLIKLKLTKKEDSFPANVPSQPSSIPNFD